MNGYETKVILCHKCDGTLVRPDKNADHLYGCGCISGWVRGFEPHLTISDAEAVQEKSYKKLKKVEGHD
jgi:hypothetical protein